MKAPTTNLQVRAVNLESATQPMRIGIMLRSLDEKGGIGVYTRYLTEGLLQLAPQHHFFLFYRNPSNLGRFVQYKNATEIVLKAPHKILWDQIAVPYASWRANLHVLLHPKFTVPLLTSCKTVMVLHGAGWFMPGCDKFWNAWDLEYVRAAMPLYCKKAAAVISVSHLTTDIFTERFRLPVGKVKTIYFGPGKQFKRIEDVSILKQTRARYNLPDRFILTLAKYGDGGRKNTGAVFEAYERIHGATPHKLVVVGKDAQLLRAHYHLPNEGYGKDIFFPGWIDQEDLPAVYSLADLFLYPSNLEAFPIPITEAMACGTPIITSSVNGLKEIAGEAALFVDPEQPDQIADAVARVLFDIQLRGSLSSKALERAKLFRWDSCARETLSVLEALGPRPIDRISLPIHPAL